MNLRLVVAGVPQPQGSTRAFVVNGHAVVTSDNRALAPWRDAIAFEARRAMGECAPLAGPLRIWASFAVHRPKSRPKRERSPDRRPDLDKLLRAVLDGLTGIVFTDDAQVCWVLARKVYRDDGWTGVIAEIAGGAL